MGCSVKHTHAQTNKAWTLTAPNWNLGEIQNDVCCISLHKQVISYDAATVTCVDVKKFALLEFLLLLLLCFFLG